MIKLVTMESRQDCQMISATEVQMALKKHLEMNELSQVLDNSAVSEKSTPSPSSDSGNLRPSDEDEYEVFDEDSLDSLKSDEIGTENAPGPSGQQKQLYYYFRMRSINKVSSEDTNECVYKCHICDKPYQQKFSLKRHFVRNHIDHKYLSPADLNNCKIIKSSNKAQSEDGIGDGKSSAGRKRHKDDNALYVDNNKTTLLKGLYRCHICTGIRFDLESELKAHYLQHKSEDKPAEFSCNLCKEIFSNKIALSKHASSHGQPIKCKKCDEEFLEKSDYQVHLLNSHGSRNECKYCSKLFSTAANRKRHENIHEEGEGFTCKHCLAVFIDSKQLESHIKEEHSKNPLTCQLCPKTGSEVFSSRPLLSAHIAAVHPGTSSEHLSAKRKDLATPKGRPSTSNLGARKAACPLCNETFQDIRAMLIHKAVAHKKKGLHKNSPLRRPSIPKENPCMESSSSEKADDEGTKTRGKKKKKVLRRRPTYKRKAKQAIKNKVMKRKIALSKKELALKEQQEERDFYSNLAQNIANNLLHHLDGKAHQLRIKNYTFNDESDDQRLNQFNIPWSAFNFPNNFDYNLALAKRGREMKLRTPEEQCLFATGLCKVVRSSTDEASCLSSQEKTESDGTMCSENNGSGRAETTPMDLQRLKEIDSPLEVQEISERPREFTTWVNSDEQHFTINHQLKRPLPAKRRKITPLTIERKLEMIYYNLKTVFMCPVCQERFSSFEHFDEHCINNHLNIEVKCLELIGDKNNPPDIPYDLCRPFCPNSTTGISYSIPLEDPSSWTCTKCKSVFSSSNDLHVHIVSCGGQNLSSLPRRKRHKLKRIKHTMKHRIDLSAKRVLIKKKKSKDAKTINNNKITNIKSATKSIKCGKDFFSTKNYKTAKKSNTVQSQGPSNISCDYCKQKFSDEPKRLKHYSICPVFYKQLEAGKSEKVSKMRIIRENQVFRVDSQGAEASKRNPVAVTPKPIPAKTVPANQNSLNTALDLSAQPCSSMTTFSSTPLDTLQKFCQSIEGNASNLSSQGTLPRVDPKNATAELNGKAQPCNKDVSKPESKKHSILKIKEVVKEMKLAASSSNRKKAPSKRSLACLQGLGKPIPILGSICSKPPENITPISKQNSTPVRQEIPAPNQEADTSRRKRKLDVPVRKIKFSGNAPPTNIPELNFESTAKETDKPKDLSIGDVSLGTGVKPKHMPEMPVSKEKEITTNKEPSSLSSKDKSKTPELSKSLVLNNTVMVEDLTQLPNSKEKGSEVNARAKSFDKSLVPNIKDGTEPKLSKSDSVKQKDLSKPLVPNKKDGTEPKLSKSDSVKQKDLSKPLVPNNKDGTEPKLSKSDSVKQKDLSKSLLNDKDSMKTNNVSKPVSKEKDISKQVNSTKVPVSKETSTVKPKPKDLSSLVTSKTGGIKENDLTKYLVSHEDNVIQQINLPKLDVSKEKGCVKQNLSKSPISKEKGLPKPLASKGENIPNENVIMQKEISNLSISKEKVLSKSPIRREKDTIPNENDVTKQDFPVVVPSKESNILQKDLPKSSASKENKILMQKDVTKSIVPPLATLDKVEDTINQVALSSDGPVSESSPTEPPDMTKIVSPVKSVVPGAKQMKDKIGQVGKPDILAKKDDDHKVSKDNVACDSIPNAPIVGRPSELIFSTGAEAKELSFDSSGRDSPTLENLVSSVAQCIEGFDDQDDERFVLPSPFLPSMNCDSSTKESSNNSLSFQIIIPRNEKQSGSFLNGASLPSAFSTFPIADSAAGKDPQEQEKSSGSETLISNQNPVIPVLKPHDATSPKVSSPLTLCSITKQTNPLFSLGEQAFEKQDQSSVEKNQAKLLVPDARSATSLTSFLKPVCSNDPKDGPSSNITSMKRGVSIGGKSSGGSVSLESSHTPSCTVDSITSKNVGLSSKRKGQEFTASSSKKVRLDPMGVTPQLHSETENQRMHSSHRKSPDEPDRPDEPSAKSAQLRALRVVKSVSTEKNSTQENTSPTNLAEKMKEKFRKSFGSGSSSTLATIPITASDAAASNRSESIASSTTPCNDSLVSNDKPSDSPVKEESELNEEDAAKGANPFEKHTCPYCFLEFRYLTNFRRHLKTCQNKRSEEVVPTPSTSTGVTRQHLPKKDEVEGCMLHLLRHQSRQSQMIKEVNKDPDTTVKPDSRPRFRSAVCPECHKIYLSMFLLMKHRLKEHKMAPCAQAGEDGFQSDSEDPMGHEDIADGDVENYGFGMDPEDLELDPEEQIEKQSEGNNSNLLDEMELSEFIEPKEGGIDEDSANSQPVNSVDVFEPSKDPIAPEGDVEDPIATEQDSEICTASATDAEYSVASAADTEGTVACEAETENLVVANADDSIATGSNAEDKTLVEQPPSQEHGAVLPNKYKELLDPSFLVLPLFGKGRGRKKKDATETDKEVNEQEAPITVPQPKRSKGGIKGKSKAKITALKIKEKCNSKFAALKRKTKRGFKKLGPKLRGPKPLKAPSESIRDSTTIKKVQNAVLTKSRKGRKPRELKNLEYEGKAESETLQNNRNDVPINDVLEEDHILTVMKNVPSQSASTSMPRRGKKMLQKRNVITNLNVPKGKKMNFNDDELSAFVSPLIDSHSTISFSPDLSIVKEKVNHPSQSTLPKPSTGSVKVIKLKSETINVDSSSSKASNTKGIRAKRSAGGDNAGDSASKKSTKQPAFLIDYYKIESSPPSSPMNDKMNIKAIKAIPKSICDIQSPRSPAVGRKPPSVKMVTLVTDEDSDADDLPESKQDAQRKKVCPICKKKFPSDKLRSRHVQLVHSRKNRGDVEVLPDKPPLHEEKLEGAKGRSSSRQFTKPVPAAKKRNLKTTSSDTKRRRL